MFRLDRGGVSAITGFKASSGDALPLLIIVRRPFSAPDPIGGYERMLHGSLKEYKDAVIIPDMLVKLLQGCERLLRVETDTGIVVFMDCCVLGSYRSTIRGALPDYIVTENLNEAVAFLRNKKDPEYFILNA